jgi:hypothetical protein
MRAARNAEFDRIPLGNLPPMPPDVARALLRDLDSEGTLTLKDLKHKKPDADFYRSVSIDQMRQWVHEDIEEMYKLPR